MTCGKEPSSTLKYGLAAQGTKAKYARPTSFSYPQPSAQPAQQTAGGVPSAGATAPMGQPGMPAGGAYSGQQPGVAAPGAYAGQQPGAPACTTFSRNKRVGAGCGLSFSVISRSPLRLADYTVPCCIVISDGCYCPAPTRLS